MGFGANPCFEGTGSTNDILAVRSLERKANAFSTEASMEAGDLAAVEQLARALRGRREALTAENVVSLKGVKRTKR